MAITLEAGQTKQLNVQLIPKPVGTWRIDATIYKWEHDQSVPLSGATLALNGISFVSDANGRIYEDDVPFGTYFFVVSHPDYMTRVYPKQTIEYPTHWHMNPTLFSPVFWPKLVQASWNKSSYQPGEQAVLTATYITPYHASPQNVLIDVEIMGLGERGLHSPQEPLTLSPNVPGTVTLVVTAPSAPHSYIAVTNIKEPHKEPPWDYAGAWAVPNLEVGGMSWQ